MRKLVLSIISALCVSPAFADELECTQETLTPSEPFVQAVMINHPDLDDSQRVAIARMYQLAYDQNAIAENAATTVGDRELAERTQNIVLRLAAIQLNTFDSLPEMQNVLEQMRAEEASGLTKVSDELEPDVRHTARTMVVIALTWGELANDVVQLSSDRFTAIVDSGTIAGAVEAAQRAMCTVEATMDVMDDVVDMFPGAMALAYVENLYY